MIFLLFALRAMAALGVSMRRMVEVVSIPNRNVNNWWKPESILRLPKPFGVRCWIPAFAGMTGFLFIFLFGHAPSPTFPQRGKE